MNKLEDKKHELVFQARMNIIYHEKSEEIFSKFINWTAFISVLFSSATIIALIPWIENSKLLIAFFSIVVTCTNAGVLAFEMLHKIGMHSHLRKKWMEVLHLAQTIDTSHAEVENEIEKVETELFKLNTEEPVQNSKRLKMAYELTCVSMGLKSLAK
ncbi:MAG: hypothetical protein ABFS56_27590 [Pseudomonadota bacterium]